MACYTLYHIIYCFGVRLSDIIVIHCIISIQVITNRFSNPCIFAYNEHFGLNADKFVIERLDSSFFNDTAKAGAIPDITHPANLPTASIDRLENQQPTLHLHCNINADVNQT